MWIVTQTALCMAAQRQMTLAMPERIYQAKVPSPPTRTTIKVAKVGIKFEMPIDQVALAISYPS